jgi:hypothetical protein
MCERGSWEHGVKPHDEKDKRAVETPEGPCAHVGHPGYQGALMDASASAEFEAGFDEGVAPAAPPLFPSKGGGEAKVERG